MGRRAWLRTIGCTAAFEDEVRNVLANAGIQSETETAGPYGIVCFESVDDPLFTLLREVRHHPQARVLAVAAAACLNDAHLTWQLLHEGASDVIVWTGNGGAAHITARLQRWFEVDDIAAQSTAQVSVVGESPAWHAVVRKLVEAAHFSIVPILLTGQSGTGKELLAKLISLSVAATGDEHDFRKELVTVDCASLVPELSGSEFFGHERGAFTGAHAQREGAFAMADGATLLLDEIGEVPLGLQAQLLRAIQEKTYKRVGGNVWQKTRFRLVCATNRDLEEAVRRGQFRLDLYYRIAGCIIRTPSLGERREDILPLTRYFLSDCLSQKAPELDGAVSNYLINRDYPGNIRELRQLVARIAHRHAGPGPVTPGDIPEDDRPSAGEMGPSWPDNELERSIANALAAGATLKEITQTTAETAIRIAVRSEGSNLQRAATRLGITDRALQMRRASGRIREQSA